MRLFPASIGLLAGLTAVPALADPVRLVPHRAVYDLSLIRSAGPSSLENARGRIAFDFGGDGCDGYTLKFRQVTVLESGETGSRTVDVRTATFEAADGTVLRFKNDSRGGSGSSETVDGEASVKDESLAIRIRQPKRETAAFPGRPLFPSAHMKRLIEAAQAGETNVSVKVYDGSDDGKKLYDTFAVIGHRIDPGAGPEIEEAARQDAMKVPRWPVTVSYYKADSPDQTPAYTLAFDLYENGVSRALRLDYGDFALRGDLKSLDVLPASTECRK